MGEAERLVLEADSIGEPGIWFDDFEGARAGNDDSFDRLLRRFRPLVNAQCRGYFAPGAAADDLRQEALIGFFKAVRDYLPDRGSFRSFVILCVRRQIITYIKQMTRTKHRVLSHSVSLDAPAFEDGEQPLVNFIADKREVPTNADDSILDFLRELHRICSPYERSVMSLYTKGYSFEEMAAETGKHYKAIDNAVWRIKVKARKLAADLNVTSYWDILRQ